MLRTSILAVMFAAFASAAHASPCDGISRGLEGENKTALEKAVAEQLHAQNADVLQTFKFDDWRIVYVDTHKSDEAYLFYSNDPLTHRYITLWSGAAMPDEEQEIRDWTLQNVPGISEKLVSCFAWHVTKNRDR